MHFFVGIIFRILCASLALAVLSASSRGGVFINEFSADNGGPLPSAAGVISGIEDVDGNSRDWIELRNSGASSVNLAGWALSDDPAQPGKWVFPGVSIPGNGYLLVFASGKNRAVAGVQLHTNFKLGKGGGTLLLSQPAGGEGWSVAHQISGYPPQTQWASYGYAGSTGPGGALGYFETQTPGAPTSAAQVAAFAAEPDASPPRGLYDSPQLVVLSSETPGATLIYTLDGSDPAIGSGTQILPPDANSPPAVALTISATVALRARAIKAGLGASPIVTHTYIFPEQVLTQNSPPAPSLNWGHRGPDWAMNASIVNHADPESRATAADLRAIATVSVVLPWADLFGGATAIYPPASGVAIEGVERLASVELLNPEDSDSAPNSGEGFQHFARVEIFGGTSINRWVSDKLSFKVNFLPDLGYRLYGAGSAGEYDNMILDARYNRVWHYGNTSIPETQRLSSSYTGDAFTGDLQRAMDGGPGPRWRPVHLYLNGLYWGMYILHERPDENFAASYLGGEADDWDVVKHGKDKADWRVAGAIINPAAPESNTNHTAAVNYLALLDLVSQDLSVPENYDAAVEKIDLDRFIEYLLLNFYCGNTDWAHQNWYATYQRTAAQPQWRWHSWDAEHVLHTVNSDVTNNGTTPSAINAGGPTYIHERLKLNFEYRLRFADIAHRNLFNGGVLTYPRVWEIYDEGLQRVSAALRAESARWGGNRAPSRPAPNTNVPYRRGVEWLAQVAFWRDTYFPARSDNSGSASSGSVLAQLKNRGLYPAVTAPVFNQHGGAAPAGFSLVVSNPGGAGTVYYTTDGTDPRNAATNTPAAGAQIYAAPLPLATSATVRARVLSGGVWSALNEASFQVDTEPASATNLVISKIHYHPSNPTSAEIAAGFTNDNLFEFIELLNIGQKYVDLTGIQFTSGLSISLLADGVRVLAPGGRALLVSNLAAFEFRYGTGLPVAGIFAGGTNLDNSGERLTLRDADGAIIANFVYDDAAPWPFAPDGDGPALVLMRSYASSAADGANWRPSTSPGGAPGADERVLWPAWQAGYFPGGGSLAQPEADPDGDSLPNLVEMFLGANPLVRDAPGANPGVAIEILDAGEGAQPYLVLTFRRALAAEELDFAAQVSTDLMAWHNTLVSFGTFVIHDDGTETRAYRTAQPLDPAAPQFLRLRVSLP